MMEIELLDRYESPVIEVIREILKEDFRKFGRGYPSYLSHMKQVVSTVEKKIGVSSNQLQRYISVQKFLNGDVNPQPGTLRFYHAYIQLVSPEAARCCASARSPQARGDELVLSTYRNFRGRAEYRARDRGIDTFAFLRIPPLGTIFGSIYDNEWDQKLRSFDETLPPGVPRDSTKGLQMEEAYCEALRKRYMTELWLVTDRQPGRIFDIAHVFLLNCHRAREAFDEFERLVRKSGLRIAARSVGKHWVMRRASGLIFWNGLEFEGKVVCSQTKIGIGLKGFRYALYRGLFFQGADHRKSFQREKGVPLIVRKGVDDFGLQFIEAMNLEYVNYGSGQTNEPFRGLIDPMLHLAMGGNLWDPPIKVYCDKTSDHGDLTSMIQLVKTRPPSLTVKHHLDEDEYRRKISVLLKAFCRYNKTILEEEDKNTRDFEYRE